MSIEQLIEHALRRIRREHYSQKVREFMRDRKHLIRAVARYGYECHQRGWEFDEAAVFCEISRILDKMRGNDDIRYLPIYLEAAIDQHIRERADELREQAIRIETHAGAALASIMRARGEQIPRTCELLAALYKAVVSDPVRKRRPRKKASRKSGQLKLFDVEQ